MSESQDIQHAKTVDGYIYRHYISIVTDRKMLIPTIKVLPENKDVFQS